MKLKFWGHINKTDSIDEIKNLVLFRSYLILTVIGLPIYISQLAFFNKVEMDILGYLQFIPLSPIFIVLPFYRKIKFSIKANILIYSIISLGTLNLYISGYTGAGIILFLTIVIISIIFLKTKSAYRTIALCVIILSTIGALYSSGIVYEQIDPRIPLHNGISWTMAVALFALLSIVLTAVFTLIFNNLQFNLKRIKKNKQDLEDTNNKLTRALIKAEESNRLKTEFFHNMSHEVRTPLNGIVGYSKLLKKRKLTPEKQNEFVDIIINSSDKLQRVIDDLVEISILNVKQQKITWSQININKFLRELCDISQLKMNGEVKFINKLSEISNDIIITSDTHILTKILGNLIENAQKFTTKGYIEIGLIDSKDTITIYVKDTGIGIHPDKQDQIFERFTQANTNISELYGGLGLGLCIAKENINILGGDITFESELDVGTTFFVKVPKEVNINPIISTD